MNLAGLVGQATLLAVFDGFIRQNLEADQYVIRGCRWQNRSDPCVSQDYTTHFARNPRRFRLSARVSRCVGAVWSVFLPPDGGVTRLWVRGPTTGESCRHASPGSICRAVGETPNPEATQTRRVSRMIAVSTRRWNRRSRSRIAPSCARGSPSQTIDSAGEFAGHG